jgi:hypothetical protein
MAKRGQSATFGFTVSADLIRGLIECAAECGGPPSRFADMVKEERGGAPPSRYAGEHILKLWERVLELSGDPIIGFRMALVAGLKTFGVLGQIAPRCATVFDAFKQTARFAALASQGARISIARDASTFAASVSLTCCGRYCTMKRKACSRAEISPRPRSRSCSAIPRSARSLAPIAGGPGMRRAPPSSEAPALRANRQGFELLALPVEGLRYRSQGCNGLLLNPRGAQ